MCRVRVTAHRAYFLNNPDQQLFITVTNLSPKRGSRGCARLDCGVFPLSKFFHNLSLSASRPMSRGDLGIYFDPLGAFDLPYAEVRARVRLSNGKEFRSIQNTRVAPVGYVPGAPHHK